MWEMRFFSPDPLVLAIEPAFALGSAPLAVVDEDTYLVGASPIVNAKLRRRATTAKLKLRVERTADGLELWREVFEECLPLGAAFVSRLARALQVERARVQHLESAATVEEALAGFSPDDEALRLVPVAKRRRLFRGADASVELAFVTLPSGVSHSLCLESESLGRLRELRRTLLPTLPASPEDYLAAFARLGAVSPRPPAD